MQKLSLCINFSIRRPEHSEIRKTLWVLVALLYIVFWKLYNTDTYINYQEQTILNIHLVPNLCLLFSGGEIEADRTHAK